MQQASKIQHWWSRIHKRRDIIVDINYYENEIVNIRKECGGYEGVRYQMILFLMALTHPNRIDNKYFKSMTMNNNDNKEIFDEFLLNCPFDILNKIREEIRGIFVPEKMQYNRKLNLTPVFVTDKLVKKQKELIRKYIYN